MSPSPRDDATEVPVEGVAVPKAGLKNALLRDNLYPMGPPASRVRGSIRRTPSPVATESQSHVSRAREHTAVDALDLGVLASCVQCALELTPF